MANGTDVALGVTDGESDAFDNGTGLTVNRVGFNLQAAMVGEGGRKLIVAPVLVGDIAVSRSIVSDGAVFATGVARFPDSFTNTSGVMQTITVQIAGNSGAYGGIVIPRTTSGDDISTTADAGFVIGDVTTFGADNAVADVFGDGLAQVLSSITRVGDVSVITDTMTLAAGQTKSLLSCATLSVTAAEATTDLGQFNVDATVLRSGGFAASPASTASHACRARETDGVIRLLVTPDNPSNSGLTVGAANAPFVAQEFGKTGVPTGLVTGDVPDDSSSGSGGVLPAVTIVYVSFTASDTVSLSGSTLSVNANGCSVGPKSSASVPMHFAINDTGIAALADLHLLATPEAEQLVGPDDAQLPGIRNFILTQADRMQVTPGDGFDNVMSGHDWGESLDGGAGDDDLNAKGSDDILPAGDGDVVLDGGRDADHRTGSCLPSCQTGSKRDCLATMWCRTFSLGWAGCSCRSLIRWRRVQRSGV